MLSEKFEKLEVFILHSDIPTKNPLILELLEDLKKEIAENKGFSQQEESEEYPRYPLLVVEA